MGLPVWRAPSPDAKDAVKVDLSASARSPIRRRSPFASRRPRSTTSPRSPRSPALLENHFLVSAARSLHSDAASRRLTPSVRPRARLPPPPVPESRNYARYSESGRDIVGLLLEDDTLMRVRHEPFDNYNTTFTSFGEVARGARQLPAFTPNFAPAAVARRSSQLSQSAERAGPSLRSRSPNRRADARSRSPWADTALGTRGNDLVLIDDGDEDSSDNNAVGFPPLRRMGRRTIADGPLPSSSLRESWSPATTIDGLGDRNRSLSPDDHWDAMQSTVAPDPIAPTAESSFASAAASASFSNSHPSSRAGSSSNSASSSRTHLTVPSRRHSPARTELFIRACDTSDSDTASDTEEEDMELRPDVPSLRRRSRQGLFSDEPPSRNPNRYSVGVRNRTRVASDYIRNFYTNAPSAAESTQQSDQPRQDQLDGPTEEWAAVDDEVQTLDQELRDARAFLERLARREDISDEWWASVGLSRALADRVDRVQQRERL